MTTVRARQGAPLAAASDAQFTADLAAADRGDFRRDAEPAHVGERESTARPTLTSPHALAGRHLADVTMFWGPASGGVRRYIGVKRAWLEQRVGGCHSVVVPASAQTAPGSAAHGEVPVPSLPLPFAPGYRVARSRRHAAQVLQQLAPDLIEAGDPYNLAWAALDAAQALRRPAVAFAHSDLPALAARAGGARARTWAERYLARLYPRFDLVLAPNRALCRRLRALGAPAVWQPLGVDTATFAPARRDPQWRTRLGIDEDQFVIVYAGRLAPEKNLPWLAQAVARLGPRYVLLLIGSGPVQLADGPFPGQVRALPYESDAARLAQALASCDVFAHAGDIETFGLAALEALACGTPAVVCGRAGLADLVPAAAGIALREGDTQMPAALAAALRTLCAERDEARGHARRAAARRHALRYDWRCVLPRLAARYAALLAAVPPRAVRATRLAGTAAAGDNTDPCLPPRALLTPWLL